MTAMRNHPGRTGLTTIDQGPCCAALLDTPRAHRAFILGELAGTALAAAVVFVRRTSRRLNEQRRARASRAVLMRLDDHTLRDLGLHRSEFSLTYAGEAPDEPAHVRARASIIQYTIPG